MLLKNINKTYQYFFSLSAIIVVTGVCFALSIYIPYRVVALLLLLTVSLIAMLFEFAPVVFASVTSAILWDFFFIPPRFTLTIGAAEDTLMLIMYFVIALVNVVLTYKLRMVEKNAMLEEGRSNTINLYNTILNSLSHELRTPISTIIAAADNLLLNPQKLNETTQKELVQEISKASLRLNYQVENLLNMSRVESSAIKLNKDWCDVSDLIYSTVNKLETQLKDHKVIINVPERFPLFKLDFGLIERALFNLVFNAALYTQKGSVITISANQSEKIIRDRDLLEKLEDELIITVADNGKGFPEEEVEKVFEKFYRLQNTNTGGTGLGLSIAKGFVEAHNGNISLENLSNGGARFTLCIPAVASGVMNIKNE